MALNNNLIETSLVSKLEDFLQMYTSQQLYICFVADVEKPQLEAGRFCLKICDVGRGTGGGGRSCGMGGNSLVKPDPLYQMGFYMQMISDSRFNTIIWSLSAGINWS